MKFKKSSLPGVFLISPELLTDDRGFFARSFCADEFTQNGLPTQYVQCNLSYNKVKGTVRGLHFQKTPHEEVKIVRCTQGAIFDVAVDFRPASPTYLKWFGAELSAENRNMLTIPEGFAHGYQTLTDDAEVFYHVSEFYTPGSEGGLRWNDEAIDIEWPIMTENEIVISNKDAEWPLLEKQR